MRPRLLIVALAALPLGSCSYVYDLLAVVSDGEVAFIVDPASSRKKPRCINDIIVRARYGPPVRPAPGDDRSEVAHAVYWEASVDISSCEEKPFPVRYGATLKGAPDVNSDGAPASFVAVKPLRIGVVYEVTTTSGAGGYGGVCFRVRPDRRIENLSDC